MKFTSLMLAASSFIVPVASFAAKTPTIRVVSGESRLEKVCLDSACEKSLPVQVTCQPSSRTEDFLAMSNDELYRKAQNEGVGGCKITYTVGPLDAWKTYEVIDRKFVANMLTISLFPGNPKYVSIRKGIEAPEHVVWSGFVQSDQPIARMAVANHLRALLRGGYCEL